MNRREFILKFCALTVAAALAPLAKLAVPKDAPTISWELNELRQRLNGLSWELDGLPEFIEHLRQSLHRAVYSDWYYSGDYYLVMPREMWEEFENILPSEIFNQEDGAFLEIIGGGTPCTT